MKRYIRAGVPCPRCGAIGKGQVLEDDLHGAACLQCAYIPGDAVKRYDPDAEAGRPDPVRRSPRHEGAPL